MEIPIRRAAIDGGLNLTALGEAANRDAKFRAIVNRAMEDSGVRDIDDKCDFMLWAVGEGYKDLPYQEWPFAIADRVKLIGVSPSSSVYDVISAAAQIWKRKRLVISVAGNGKH